MVMKWVKSEPFLVCDGTKVKCWSKVRNELNGLRPRRNEHDVCISINKDGSPGVPIMPRTFPVGEWKITGFKEHPDKATDGYLYPVFIRTDAVNKVPEWKLDENGFYSHPTGRIVDDYFNGIHFSACEYTQGCLRIADESDIRWLWQVLNVGDDFIVSE
jgi:hypothetical protein